MSFSNAQIAQQVVDLIARWNTREDEMVNWLGGTVGGGVGADGKYPLTDYYGVTDDVTCPAQLEDDVLGAVADAETAQTAAETAQTAAEAAEASALNYSNLADADRISAETHKNNAATSASAAANDAATALAQANNAATSATNAATSETNAATSETNAGISETNAAASAAAAAASAVEAATFDPLNFYLRTALDGGQLDNRYYTETEIDATFANYTLTSGLSISNWNTAYGWGDHASGGYAASGHNHSGVYEPADATIVFDADFASNGILKRTAAGAYGIVTDNSANWNTAYGWGDHASGGYAALAGSTTQRFSVHTLTLTNVESTDIDLAGELGYDANDSSAPASLGTYASSNPAGLYLNDSGTVVSTIYHTGHFSGTHIANWQTAYGWGDHASGGYAASGHNHSGVYEPADATILKDADIGVNVLAYSGTVVYDADFASNGILKRTAAGVYGIVTDNSTNWNTAYGWGDHASGGYAASGHNHSGVYEPAFSKNTGFNKNLGTSAGTVSEGDHTHAGGGGRTVTTDAANTSVDNTVTETTVFSHTFGAGDLTTDDVAFFKVGGLVLNNMGSTQTLKWKLTLDDGTEVTVYEDIISMVDGGAGGTRRPWWFNMAIAVRSQTNSMLLQGTWGLAGPTNFPTTGKGGMNRYAEEGADFYPMQNIGDVLRTDIDFSSAVTLRLKITWGTANSNLQFDKDWHYVDAP